VLKYGLKELSMKVISLLSFIAEAPSKKIRIKIYLFFEAF